MLSSWIAHTWTPEQRHRPQAISYQISAHPQSNGIARKRSPTRYLRMPSVGRSPLTGDAFYAACVSARPLQALGILAVGLSPKRAANIISQRSSRFSPRSIVPNSFCTQPVIDPEKRIRISMLDEDGQAMCNGIRSGHPQRPIG